MSSQKPLQKPRIGIDCMGETFPLSSSLKDVADVTLLALSDPVRDSDVHFVPADELISMDDNPLTSVRKKKNASLTLGIKLLRDQAIDALITRGNTGALTAAAKSSLSTFKGVKRPGLLALIPTKNHPVAVLDVGANVQSSADQLYKFAEMGIAFQKVLGIKNPRVALLNIGEEAMKGREEFRLSNERLNAAPHINFIGNVEGRDVFEGICDVLITDGFTGNVFLKTAEGVAEFVTSTLGHAITDQADLNYAEHPGAILLGVQGLILKVHGSSPPSALERAALFAVELVQTKLIENVSSMLEEAP